MDHYEIIESPMLCIDLVYVSYARVRRCMHRAVALLPPLVVQTLHP